MLLRIFCPRMNLASARQPGGEVWMGDELFMAWLELEEFQKVRRLIAIERGNAWEPIGVL